VKQMLHTYNASQNTNGQPVIYDPQMRRVPTWPSLHQPYINELSTQNAINQYYNNMNVYPNGLTGNYFPRSNSLNSMNEVIVPMAASGLVQGNLEGQQHLAFPNVSASQFVPAQFHSQQSSYETQAAFTQTTGYQQPVQAWLYNHNHYTQHQQSPTVHYALPQQAVMFNASRGRTGGEEGTPKIPMDNLRTRQTKGKPYDYNERNAPQFHGSHVGQHMLYMPVQPRFVNEAKCVKGPISDFVKDKGVKGKEKTKDKMSRNSVSSMPARRPRSSKKSRSKRPWKGERQPPLLPKISAGRKKRRNRAVAEVITRCANKVKEGSAVEGRKKRRPPVPLISEVLTKVGASSCHTPLRFTQTPPESSDEVSVDIKVIEQPIVGQPVQNDVTLKNPNGRSACTFNSGPHGGVDKESKLAALFPELPPLKVDVANPQDEQDDERLEQLSTKHITDSPPTAAFVSEEQEVLSLKSDIASSKELTPSTINTSEITTPGSSCKVGGTKPPIPFTPLCEINTFKPISQPAPLVKNSPTVPPLRRCNWSPAPLPSEFKTLPLIFEPTVREDPWQMVKKRNRRRRSVQEKMVDTASPEQPQTPPVVSQVLAAKQVKRSRRRRKKKKERVSESVKPVKNLTDKFQGEPLVEVARKRKSKCDFLMDCLFRVFSYTRVKEKTY